MALSPLNLNIINKTLTKIAFNDYPSLNVNASHLSAEGISLNIDSPSTTPLDGMTQVVQSVQAYMKLSITINILKTSNLYMEWFSQVMQSCYVGSVTLYCDSKSMTELTIQNCAISSLDSIALNGTTAYVPFKVTGSIDINKSCWGIT